MGIDIYLNGCGGWEQRTKAERQEFDAAVERRDALPEDCPAHDEEQVAVNVALDKLHSASTGYLRSSYNSGGLFYVLEEIFGFDVAEYLFPGDWDDDVKINGAEFVAKVRNLERTALAATKANRRAIPWIDLFTDITGQRAPDPNGSRIQAEVFAEHVWAYLSAVGGGKWEPEPRESRGELSKDYVRYLTNGLKDLREFGELAVQLNEKGQETFAYISY